MPGSARFSPTSSTSTSGMGRAGESSLKPSATRGPTGTRILFGESGRSDPADEARDARLRAILADQLALYQRHGASWGLWMYKDIGRQGLVSVRPDTPYRRRFDAFVATKNRLGVDQWGSAGVGGAPGTQAVQGQVAIIAPRFAPAP